MSAVASQPLITIRTVAVRVAVAPLTVLVVASAVIRTLVAWSRATPAYFPDEYMYSQFGRSIAHGHLPAVRGVPSHFLPMLQPLITAPGWLLPGVENSYRAVQAIDATFMSLAAIPVYLLARRLGLSSRYSLVAGALSLTVPSLLLSSFVISEPIAYPIVLAAVYAAVHALDRPSWRSYALLVGVAGLAAFARIQFAVLLPIFLVAVPIVALRERRLREFVRQFRIPLAALIVIAGALFAAGPARNSGYYPSLFFIPNFHPATAAEFLGVETVVLMFASGFLIVPGALLGLWLSVVKPRERAEMAFGVVTIFLTVALLVQAVVYGNLGYVQERYLFYLLPLWTIAFLLYAQRGWPLKIVHAVIAVGVVGAALAVPLSKYAVGGGQQHSALLFALTWLSKPTASIGAAAVMIAYAAGAGVVILIGLSFRWPRVVTPFALGFALIATTAASAGAIAFDHSNAGALKSVILGDNPSWVDEAGVGPTTLLLTPGSRIPDAKLFWNTSLDRVLLLPGVKPPDAFTVQTIGVRRNGVITASGKPITGSLMVDDWGTTVQLQQATFVKRTTSGVLYRPHGDIRLRMLTFGRYSDGWLAGHGAMLVWPNKGEHGLAGRLELSFRAPRPDTAATVKVREPGTGRTLAFIAKAGKTRKIVIQICSTGPVSIPFQASPEGGLGDGRQVAARTGQERFVPDASVCPPPTTRK